MISRNYLTTECEVVFFIPEINFSFKSIDIQIICGIIKIHKDE